MNFEQIGMELCARGDIRAFGVMPRLLIYSIIEDAVRSEGDACPFIRADSGFYIHRKHAQAAHNHFSAHSDNGIITCWGWSWRRDLIRWSPIPELIGCQFQDSSTIDFCEQVGLYAIRDANGFLLDVGLTGEGGLGKRLYEKTTGSLDNSFKSFDFYGVRPVLDDGALGPLPTQANVSDALASMLFAVAQIANPCATDRLYDRFWAMEFFQRH